MLAARLSLYHYLSPNLGVLAPSANLSLTSGVKGASLNTDGIANAVLVFKSTTKISSRTAEALCSAKYFSRKAGTEALCSARYLRCKAEAPLCAKSEVTMTSLPKSSDAKLAPYGGATRLTSPSEIDITDKVIFKSPKNRSLRVRGLQPQ